MSDVKESFEKTLQKCEEYKNDVKAYIVLMVTDKKDEDGQSAEGINSMGGKRQDLLNLILNIDKDLAKEAYFMGALTKIAKDLFKDD